MPVVPFVVRALCPPALLRWCPRCDQRSSFVSSGRFRVNAQKRRLDVWLVRKCARCDSTWNQPVHERVTVASLADQLERYSTNDPALAWAAAFDLATLRAHGEPEASAFRVERPDADPPFHVEVRLVDPLEVRLEAVLCAGLAISRSHLRRLADAGAVVSEHRLDRRAPDGAAVWVASLDATRQGRGAA